MHVILNGVSIELDHFFVITDPGAPQADALVAAGFLEGPPNRHPGQGTACRRFYFTNSMLELLWIQDPEEAGSALAARTRLAQRARGRGAHASPFGLCLRPSGAEVPSAPFPSWRYTPDFLPADFPAIEVSCRSELIAEPFMFYLPFSSRAGPNSTGPSELSRHPCGARELTRLILRCPTPDDPDLLALGGLAALSVQPSAHHQLELVLDDARQGEAIEIADLGLLIRY